MGLQNATDRVFVRRKQKQLQKRCPPLHRQPLSCARRNLPRKHNEKKLGSKPHFQLRDRLIIAQCRGGRWPFRERTDKADGWRTRRRRARNHTNPWKREPRHPAAANMGTRPASGRGRSIISPGVNVRARAAPTGASRYPSACVAYRQRGGAARGRGRLFASRACEARRRTPRNPHPTPALWGAWDSGAEAGRLRKRGTLSASAPSIVPALLTGRWMSGGKWRGGVGYG